MFDLKLFNELMDEYKKNEVLKDICEVHYANGLHAGRWEEEESMDESAEEYLATMVAIAENYHLEYDKELSNYIKDEEYEAKCYTMDRMGSHLQELIEYHLIKILND